VNGRKDYKGEMYVAGYVPDMNFRKDYKGEMYVAGYVPDMNLLLNGTVEL